MTDTDLLPYLRQYQHNDGSGLVFGYEKEGVDRLVAMLRAAARPAPTLTFDDALRMARGCSDYGGGYRGEEWEIFQHGIQTVRTVLSVAADKGMADSQVSMVHAIGSQPQP